MKKIIFYSTPAFGHISPALNIMRAYVDAGYEVHFYSTKTFKDAIDRTGALYHEYDFDESRLDLTIGSKLLQLENTILTFATELTEGLLAESKEINPEFIFHDNIAIWGRIIGKMTGIPAVSINSFPVVPSMFSKGGLAYTLRFGGIILKDISFVPDTNKKKKILTSRYPGVKFNMLSDILNQEDLNLITFPAPIQPGSESMKDKYYFVGPTIPDPDDYFSKGANIDDLNTENLIFISLGTVFNNNPDFYINTVNQFRDSKYNLLVSMSPEIEAYVRSKTVVPDNVQIRKFVPQGKVLDKTILYVGAGGMNSICQAAYRRVPCLLYPQEGEQAINSKGLCNLGLARILKKPSNIYAECERLLSEYKPTDEALKYFDEPDYAKLFKRIDDYVEKSK